MKHFNHIIGATFLAMGSVAAMAQTEGRPLPLNPGENSYTESESTTYWRYTPEADELVKLVGVGISSVVNSDTNESLSFYSVNNYDETSQSVFQVEAGMTYTIKVTKDYYETKAYTFTATMTPHVYNTGQKCSDAIKLSEGENFIPAVGVYGGWYMPTTYTPIYAEYTAPNDGVLDIKMPLTPNSVSWTEAGPDACDASFAVLPESNSVSIDVEEGKTYLFKFEELGGFVASFETRIPVPGASCDDAWTAVSGKNVIPAAAGTYWYKLTVPQKSYLTILSEADATLTIDNSCHGPYPDPTTYNSIAVRMKVYGSSNYVFSITKAADTAADEEFTMSFEAAEPYDAMDTAEEIEPGTYATPQFDGTYYYAFTAPAGKDYFIDVTLNTSVSNTRVALREWDDDWSSYDQVAYGATSVHYPMTPGVKYMIEIGTPVNAGSIPFTVALAEVETGQTVTNPFTAVEGDNTLPAWKSIFFKYTAEKSSWMTLSFPEGMSQPRVYFANDKYSSPASKTVRAAEGYASAVKYQLAEGNEYILEFSDNSTEAKFDLTLSDYALGEYASNPFLADNDGYAELPYDAGNYWFKYTVANDGFLLVDCDMPYNTENGVNSATIYKNEIKQQNSWGLPYDWNNGGYEFSPLKLTVVKGDVVYVCVEKKADADDQSVTFTEKQADPGETPASAIKVELVDNKATTTVPAIDYSSNPVYYVIALEPGILNIENSRYSDGYLYSDIACEKTVAGFKGFYNAEDKYVYGCKDVAITTAGNYYVKVTSNGKWGDDSTSTMTFSLREPEEGEAPSSAIEIETPTNPTVFALEGIDYGVTRWYKLELFAGELNITTEQAEAESSAARSAARASGFYADFELYSPEDLATPMASMTPNYETDVCSLTAQIPAAGTYYLKLLEMYNTEGDITISGSALENTSDGVKELVAGEFAVVSQRGGLLLLGDASDVCVYDINGRLIVRTNVEGSKHLSLAAGIYVVTNGSTSAKAIVK